MELEKLLIVGVMIIAIGAVYAVGADILSDVKTSVSSSGNTVVNETLSYTNLTVPHAFVGFPVSSVSEVMNNTAILGGNKTRCG